MSLPQKLANWFDVRPGEVWCVWVSLIGAFLVMGFGVATRAMREALYLSAFTVEALPYITAAVALLSLPTVSAFTRLLSRHEPTFVLARLILVTGGGLLVLWPLLALGSAAVVVFYVWTALMTLVLSSGFWVVTSELFPVRGAKRVYGIIAAGGTAGSLVAGISLTWITSLVGVNWIMPFLLLALALFYLSHRYRAAAQPPAPDRPPEDMEQTPARESLRAIWRSRHLRLLAMLALAATVTTTLVDYQFKEMASRHAETAGGLTSFLGSFYGWTGGIALAIQLLLANFVVTRMGVSGALAVLPLLLLLGSGIFLVAPGLVLITLVRGTDYSLRKALHRPTLEILHVPLPTDLRRRTKTFLDSVVESGAEGTGALIIFLWVTLAGWPSRNLSVLAVIMAGVFLYLAVRMGRRYHKTIRDRLQQEAVSVDLMAAPDMTLDSMHSDSFSHAELQSLITRINLERQEEDSREAEQPGEPKPPSVAERMASPQAQTALTALKEVETWDTALLRAALRLVARDDVRLKASVILARGDLTVAKHLGDVLLNEDADFVIRRRIPAILMRMEFREADSFLLEGLTARRFEIRYRCAVALIKRRERRMPQSRRNIKGIIWRAIEFETNREAPVWELQRLLDSTDRANDGFVVEHTGIRGELSLEHTFRLMSMVLDPNAVRAAFQGIVLSDDSLKSFTLEYLEHVLPPTIKARLWRFIGDLGERQRKQASRPLQAVVDDLMSSRDTLFAGEEEREVLRRMLEDD